jgi:hypothetical protein
MIYLVRYRTVTWLLICVFRRDEDREWTETLHPLTLVRVGSECQCQVRIRPCLDVQIWTSKAFCTVMYCSIFVCI